LGKIQTSNELEILSIENEENLFVVVVSARTEKGQEAKIVELMKKFEQNASKLKRSKSLENIFADVLGAIPSEDGDTTRKLLGPRRTLTWDVRSNKPPETKSMGKSLIRHTEPSIPEIPENPLRRCASSPGSSSLLDNSIPEYPPTLGTPTLTIPEEEAPKLSPKKQLKKKHKKMKVKMFHRNPTIKEPENNNNNNNNPPVVSSPEEEIIGF
jgi:hypothetical protein